MKEFTHGKRPGIYLWPGLAYSKVFALGERFGYELTHNLVLITLYTLGLFYALAIIIGIFFRAFSKVFFKQLLFL